MEELTSEWVAKAENDFYTADLALHAGDFPIPDTAYTLEPKHPVFSTPNSGFSLIHYSPVWFDKGGDYIRLTSGSDAILLAGGHIKEKSSYGLIATCFDGRVIFQTFSNHDYRRSDIQMLWQNYITNTLQKRFEAVP
ncbi:MAG: hypothetical protein QMD04_09760 [Anaerolineales bacterium]|nr:hypothetical protein [Anaerolineales bacterium]